MATFGKTLRTSVAAVLMLAATTTGAQAFRGGAVLNRASGLQIRGNVVCAGCSLEEARKAQPDPWGNHLYQLTHKQGQVVIEVNRVSDPQWWDDLTVPRIRVRAEDSLFEQLTAEGNLFKEVEITGTLRNSQTLDVSKITIGG